MGRGRRAGKPRAPKQLDQEQLYWYAVKALAARARSVAEMRRLLQRRAARPEDVRAVLARLKERGYLNDQRFAESFAAARLENQRLGRVRVVHDLRLHLVAPEVAERAARKAYEGVEEAELIRQQLARRLRHASPPETPRKVASLYRALRRAGFSHGAILAELRQLKTDTELLESLGEESLE